MSVVKKVYWYLFIKDLNVSAAAGAIKARSWKQKLFTDITTVVLISYLLTIFSTAIPVIADGFAHIFWKKQHLQSEHRIFGKDHLGKALSKLERQQSKENNEGSVKAGLDDLKYFHPFNKNSYLRYSSVLKNFTIHIDDLLLDLTLTKNDPPPERISMT